MSDYIDKAKILIVDDDSKQLRLLEHILQSYQVETAEDGHTALKKIPSFLPDLIVLDVSMPGLSGYEVCREIRTNAEYRLTKVVFLSANDELEERLAGYEAGGDDYLSKPYNPSELLAKLRVLLRLKTVEEVDQIKRDALALLAHETGTPLSIIYRICDDIAEQDSPDPVETKKAMKVVLRSVRRLERHAERAILAGQIRSSQNIPLRQVLAAELVEQVCEELAEDAEEKGVRVQTNVSPAEFLGHARYLAKALFFVLENAIKFSPKDQVVIVSGDAVDGNYLFRVSDRGPGIDLNRLDQIFELFSVRDIAHHQAGLGISLALAREMISCHDGKIDVECREGQG